LTRTFHISAQELGEAFSVFRCTVQEGPPNGQSANSLQLLERPLHGESKFVRQSA